MAQVAQQGTAAAAATVKQSIRALERYLQGDNPSPRLLQSKLDKLAADKDELVAKHYLYGDKSNQQFDSEEMLQWITPILDNVMDISDQAFLKIETLQQAVVFQRETQEQQAVEEAKTNEITVAELQYKTNENALRERIDSMIEIVSDDTKSTDDDANLIRTYLRQIDDFMSEQIKSWNAYKSLTLSADKLRTVFTEEEELKKHVSENCLLAIARVNKIQPESVLPLNESTASNTGSGSVIHENYSSSVKTEKIKHPTFNGDIRSFARFKADFKDIVVPGNPSIKTQIYILKEQCLQGDTKKLVANMTDLTAIWERLESRYGDEIEIVNSVISEIQDFQFSKSEHDRSLIRFVDKLEKGVEDLSAIEARSHIANAYTVKLLESKLSREVRLRWFQHEDVSKINPVANPEQVTSIPKVVDRRFELMLEFLKKERKQAERLSLTSSKQPMKPKDPPANENKRNLFNGATGGGVNSTPTPKKQCLVHSNGNHFTRKCKVFLSKSVDERGSIVKDAGACKFCLGTSHSGQPCPFEATWSKCGVQGCDQPHSRLLHGCQIQGISCFVAEMCNKNISANQTLLLIQSISTAHVTETIAFWDGGSTLTLVSRSYARRNNLQGVPIIYDLITVGGEVTTHNTMLYEITIVTRKGEHHVIQAFEIEDICGSMTPVNTKQFAKLFPSTKPYEISRPSGEIDILIGNNYAPLHPDKKHVCQGLVLYQSQFGTGKILGGAHIHVNETVSISAGAHLCAKARVCNVCVSRRLLNPGLDFITTEAFGVEPPRICDDCKGCKNCTYDVHQISREDQEKIKLIREHMTLDPVSHKWTVQYPCRIDPNKLKNNKEQAKVLAERTENRLIKEGTLSIYNEQMYDMLDRGVIVEIKKEEDECYNGPVFHVSHHDVRKPNSSSTPIRLVINSSLRYLGLSPNDVWIQCPNQLNDMWGILIRFRAHKIALVGDIKKMYNSIHTTSTEKHMRRILWRFGNKDEEFTTYGVDQVMFGDRPAATITAIAIRETAEIYKNIDEVAAEKIKEDTYVDDIATGVDEESELAVLKNNMKAILGKAGLEAHEFVRSGDNSEETLALLGSGKSRVLGTGWSPPSDEFSVTVKINVSKKYRGARTEQDYTMEDIPKLIAIALTRRILQGIVYSFFDVYGLVAPITIQMKIELRNLFSKDLNLSWDEPVPEEIKKTWIQVLQKVKSVERVKFRRCIKPDGPVVGKPDLIICNDASREVMCATAHVRWGLEDGSVQCFLYAAKTRVAPLRKESIPRLEMQSAVMGARLRRSITMNTTLEFNEITHVLDSKCTLAILHKETISLKEFMGNRASEVQKKTDVDEWVHTSSKDNIADLGTRKDATVEDVSKGSEWQDGKRWMKLSKEEWPVSKDFSGQDIPTEELITKGFIAFASSIDNVMNMYDIERFRGRSYIFLINVTARVLNVFNRRSANSKCSLKEIATPLTHRNIIAAEKFCIQLSMHYTKPDFTAGKFKSLRAQIDDEGIVCVNSRANQAMQSHYGCDKFPILTYKDPLAYIWMQHAHNDDHSGITKTVAKSRRKFWVIRARKLAEKIKKSCYTCRRLDKELAQQLMAPLPDSRVKISPTFYVVSMDLWGPIKIKDTVKQLTRKKVWGVIFTCTVTRATYLDLTEDYSTDAILQTLRRFVSIRGCPGEIQSDQGSQLIAAAKDIARLVEKWDWKPIHEWAANNKIKWTLAPAEGQHQNGLSESLIKITKRSIEHQIMNNVLTFSQLQMVLFEVANIMNSRPLGVISGSDPECPSPITPNDVILGRASSEVPQGPFDHDQSKNITKKFRFLQNLVSQWWNEWYQSVFPSLVPCYKWLQRHRNVQVGDICLIRYRKETRATYRMGRVNEVRTGVDGLVRSVVLQYKLPNEKVFRTVDRPIHGICVIVPVEEQQSTTGTDKTVIDNSALNPCASTFIPSC